MKAKEYANKIKVSDDKAQCIFEVIKDILIESKSIVEARRIKTGSSILDIFDELEHKWLAVVRHTKAEFKDDPRNSFRFVFKKLVPEMYDEWELHKVRHKVRSESFKGMK